MWESSKFTILWASTAYCRDSFTFYVRVQLKMSETRNRITLILKLSRNLPFGRPRMKWKDIKKMDPWKKYF
jgi:hypothetical protein